jgi:hypothetical protein
MKFRNLQEILFLKISLSAKLSQLPGDVVKLCGVSKAEELNSLPRKNITQSSCGLQCFLRTILIFFGYFCSGLECVCHSFAYVAHLLVLDQSVLIGRYGVAWIFKRKHGIV